MLVSVSGVVYLMKNHISNFDTSERHAKDATAYLEHNVDDLVEPLHLPQQLQRAEDP